MDSVAIQPANRPSRLSAHLVSVAVFGVLFASWGSFDAEAAPRRSKAKAEPAIEATSGPKTIVISLRKQRLRLFDGTREIASSRISSGMRGFDTPTGVFSILEKKVYHESNIYDGAPMPFMQRVTWSGIALHAGVVPGIAPRMAACVCPTVLQNPSSAARSLAGG